MRSESSVIRMWLIELDHKLKRIRTMKMKVHMILAFSNNRPKQVLFRTT